MMFRLVLRVVMMLPRPMLAIASHGTILCKNKTINLNLI